MKRNKISRIIRNILGVFFVFIGIVGMFSNGLIAGIFMMLFGFSLLPIFYEKTNLNKKYIQIILPIILIFLFAIISPKSMTETNSNINEITTNIVQEEKPIEISALKFNESEIELDIKESKEIVLEILPNNANAENLQLCSSDSQIAILEKSNAKNSENRITLKIKPITEGNCEIYAKSSNGIESNRISLKIVDNDKIEKEKKDAEEQANMQAEKEAQENAKIQAEKLTQKEANGNVKVQAEEQDKKETKENVKKQAEEKNKKQPQKKNQSNTNASSKSTSSSINSNSNNTHGKSVYITPTGKRYHFNPNCGGPNSRQTTLANAKSLGLTPCRKCAK